MELQTKVNIRHSLQVSHSTKVFMIGSCFAESMAEKLSASRFSVVTNPMGITYNPVSIASQMEILLNNREFTSSDLIQTPDGWTSWIHHGRFTRADRNSALKVMNEELHRGAQQLKEADLIIITFGSSRVYEYEETVVSNCHKLPSSAFSERLLTIDEIVEATCKWILSLKTSQPKTKIMFTVSPVRYLGRGAHDGQHIKATLLLAIDEIQKKMGEQICYFPSYEIMMDELRDYRFYADDMIHPSSLAVNYIWQRFVESQMHPSTRKLMLRIDKVNRMLAHRPLHPDTEEWKRFVRQREIAITEIETEINNAIETKNTK